MRVAKRIETNGKDTECPVQESLLNYPFERSKCTEKNAFRMKRSTSRLCGIGIYSFLLAARPLVYGVWCVVVYLSGTSRLSEAAPIYKKNRKNLPKSHIVSSGHEFQREIKQRSISIIVHIIGVDDYVII